MNNRLILLFLSISLVIGKNNIYYKTWSLENGTNYSFIDDAIALWNIAPLEFARVEPGKGDIKIYFKKFPANDSRLGYAFKYGDIYMKENLDEETLFYALQHEFGHALGLDHNNNNTLMYNVYQTEPFNVTDCDKKNLLKLYNCKFDSVTLINYYTYLVFAGSHYKRLDLNTVDKTEDELWIPFVNIVDSMYRTESGSYIIISNKEFFEFDLNMNFIRQGLVQTLFPRVEFVDAVLKLRNGSTFIFSNFEIYRDGSRVFITDFSYFPDIEWPIRGAFQTSDETIQIVDEWSLYTFDKNFIYQHSTELCKTVPYLLLHCCNE